MKWSISGAEAPSRLLGALVVLLLHLPAHAVEKTSWKFVFGNQAKTGYTSIGPTNVYAVANGYGFDFGFDKAVRYTPSKDGIEGKAAPRNPYDWTGMPFHAPRHQAFLFSANVPVGNYEVRITMGSKDSASGATIRAEQRRLMIEDWTVPAGRVETRVIHVNRRKRGTSLTTREQGYIDLDDRLTIEFNGDHPILSQLEITKIDTDVTVYLAGNSTVVDQPQEPWGAWGQIFPRFFGPGVAISNHAESGLSAQSFVGARLDNILSTLKSGDHVFVEFGHNDAKNATATANFSANLTTFATKVKAKGGKTVLVTPTARNLWNGSRADNSALADFVAKMKVVSAAQGIDLLDLNAASIAFIEALTPANSRKAYCYFPANTVPGQGAAVPDGTHWNGYGAYVLAKWMATEVKRKNLGFAKHLAADQVDLDPTRPDAYAGFSLPFSPLLDPSFVPPDSAVGPSVGSRRRSLEDASVRIVAATLRHGNLDLELSGDADRVEIRVLSIDGTIEATGTFGAGEGPRRHLRIGATPGLRVVEARRGGRLLDLRKILQHP